MEGVDGEERRGHGVRKWCREGEEGYWKGSGDSLQSCVRKVRGRRKREEEAGFDTSLAAQ